MLSFSRKRPYPIVKTSKGEDNIVIEGTPLHSPKGALEESFTVGGVYRLQRVRSLFHL